MTQLIASQADRFDILPPGEGAVYVTAAPHAMRMDDRIQIEIPAGASLADMVAQVQPDRRWHSHTIVMLGGEPIDRALWGRIRPKPGTHVVIRTVAQGGGGGDKNLIATVLSVALIVATVVVAPYLAPGLAAATGMTVGVSQALIGAGINLLGGLLINAIAPPPRPTLGQVSGTQGRDSATYQIQGARNRAAVWQPVPLVLGRHRIVPPYGAQPYTEISGNDQYLRLLFVVGYGIVDVSDIKIGDTPISQFDNVSTQVRGPGVGTSLYSNQVVTTDVGVPLSKEPITWANRTTAVDADEISVDLIFPQGIFWVPNDSPDRLAVRMQVEIQYKLTSSSTWLNAPGFPRLLGGKQTSAMLRGYSWSVPTGQYDVRVRRLRSTTSAGSELIQGQGQAQVVVDTLQWTILRTIRHTEPVSTEIRDATTRLAVRIRASEQLQRVVDTLSCLAEPEIPDWTGSSWVTRKTSNPASIYRHLLQGPQSPKPLSNNRIDIAGLQAFHEHCDSNGFLAEGVVDYDTTLFEQLQAICSAGRAAFGMRDGKFSVIVDKEQSAPIQHFTPRNSWGFEAEKIFPDRVHAFRVRFADRDSDYRQDERIVYDDGFNAGNATQFEELDLPYATDRSQIYKLTRYYLASARLRPEQYRLTVDLAHIVCTRGDLVRVQHDVMLVGLASGRIKSIETDGSGDVTAITLDERVTMVEGTNYGVVIVSDLNVETTRPVMTDPGETATLTLSSPIAAAGAPEPGWLVIFGEHGTETIDAIVNRIEMLDDLQARLTLVDAAPAVLHAADGPIPPFDPGITLPQPDPQIARPLPPRVVSIETGAAALARTPEGLVARAIINLAPRGDVEAAGYIVRYRRTESGGDDVQNDWISLTSDGTEAVILRDVAEGETYEFQARSFTQFGVSSFWTEPQIITVIGQTEPPADVSGFSANVVDGQANLDWDANTEADLSHYRIRYSPTKQGATWVNAVDLVTKVGKPATSITVPALVGTYLIKAVDLGGRESVTAAAAITNIARVQGLNFVEAVENQNPDWPGDRDGVYYSDSLGGLVLDAAGDLYDADDLYATGDLYRVGGLLGSGTYLLDEVVDLQEPFTARLVAEIETGAMDLDEELYAVGDLYDVGNLYGAVDGAASVRLQVRTTDEDPANENWSDWIPFVVGDYTARAFQFRLRFLGQPPSVTPIVTRVYAEIDMEDRVVGFEADIPSGGARVNFDPAFFVKPEIGISVEDGQEGDRYTITNKSPTGFDIAFTNGGSSVARQISGVAKAYGEKAA